ncbi:SLATT domain-containing protein [Streptomyces sp. NA04227]|uniref:SLATT domain-containing protein n=1 Tax=Streptomyces sp. NA04227 TaxID=2742136 RepID=UPI0015907375|nr:SLATT domain-containing protein [Streptomyces sp. NA04227]QKW07441.1 SLATT domain-containing protein [Streptomyces sp. NA04227]
MSQPEKQPEGPPQRERDEGGGGGPAGTYEPRNEATNDLRGRRFPHGDWEEPAARLDELYRWVEQGALQTADWYLTDRIWKRRGARLLRGGAALAAVTAAALPLLAVTDTASGAAPWAFVALLIAVACVVCDRYFGLSSGWIRDVATAQAVQRRLQALQFDWASECVREVLGPAEGTASEATERCLTVLRRFSEDITELVRAETAGWMVEFRSGPAPLSLQASLPGTPRGEGAAPAGRFPLPPGARPNMPRQRPPEPL